MRGSIETREPFLDPDLVALAVNLPLEARVEPSLKSLLREVAAPHLPATIVGRPKVGFGFDSWRYITPAAQPEFLRDGHLRELAGVPREEWNGIVERARFNQALLLWTGEIWCRVVLGATPADRVAEELWADPVAEAA
jgi:asparagine synthetase B (glutamine-hydrolysing)